MTLLEVADHSRHVIARVERTRVRSQVGYAQRTHKLVGAFGLTVAAVGQRPLRDHLYFSLSCRVVDAGLKLGDPLSSRMRHLSRSGVGENEPGSGRWSG